MNRGPRPGPDPPRTEALIRARGDILYGRVAAVLGFGKLGSSVARMLHARGVQVVVYDIDPVKRAQALAQGFATSATLGQALAGSEIVVCATGNLALKADDFARVANGAYIASVRPPTTSSNSTRSTPCTGARASDKPSPGMPTPGTSSTCSTRATP